MESNEYLGRNLIFCVKYRNEMLKGDAYTVLFISIFEVYFKSYHLPVPNPPPKAPATQATHVNGYLILTHGQTF